MVKTFSHFNNWTCLGVPAAAAETAACGSWASCSDGAEQEEVCAPINAKQVKTPIWEELASSD